MAKKSSASFVDPRTPKVPLVIAGKSYSLTYDFNALVQAEDLTGMNLLRCMDFQDLTAKNLRALLFASLLKHQPDITLEEAGELIGSQQDGAKVVQAIVACYIASQPKAEEGDSKNAQ